MNLIIGIEFLIKDSNQHRQAVRMCSHMLWEKFLSNLVYSYRENKSNKKMEINVYISRIYEDKDCYYLFEYVIPAVLVDYYGIEEFKSILPKGSMVDLVRSK